MRRVIALFFLALVIVGSYFAALAINSPRASEGVMAFASIALPGIVTGLVLTVRAMWNVRGRSMARRSNSANIIDLVEARRRLAEKNEAVTRAYRDAA